MRYTIKPKDLPNGHYELLRWVTLALSKDTTRGWLQALKVEPERLTACDGRRVHVAEQGINPLILPVGFYSVLKSNTKELVLETHKPITATGKYPSIARVMPDVKRMVMRKYSSYADRGGTAIAVIAGRNFDSRFLDDAACGANVNKGMERLTATVYYSREIDSTPVIFKTVDRWALIMPVIGTGMEHEEEEVKDMPTYEEY